MKAVKLPKRHRKIGSWKYCESKVLDVPYESNTEVVSTTEALEVPETLVHKIHKKLPNSAEKSTATLTYLTETDLIEGLISNTFQKLVMKLWMKMIS